MKPRIERLWRLSQALEQKALALEGENGKVKEATELRALAIELGEAALELERDICARELLGQTYGVSGANYIPH